MPLLASNQSRLCAKCDHLLHFEENWELFRFCWRYFDVYTLFPLYFTRRMQYTPVFGVESSRPVRKMRSCTRFWKKLCVISLLLEIFRRLYCICNAFYTPIAARAVFSVDTSPAVRKMRPFTRFWRKLRVISLLLEILRRLNANSITFHTPNDMHASFIVET